MIEIHPARVPDDRDSVVSILREYIVSPSVDLGFQDYEPEFASLPGNYAPPEGRLLLARLDGAVVGCAALRRIDSARCEHKRVYVRPAARGLHLGRLLVEHMINEARQ